jgi:hypothetical protein
MADLIARVAGDLHRAALGEKDFDVREYPPIDGVLDATAR